MNVSLGTTSIMFTTTNICGEWERVTLLRSTVRVLMGSLAHEDAKGEMAGLAFLKLALKAEPITENHRLAMGKLIDLGIDAVEAGALVEWEIVL